MGTRVTYYDEDTSVFVDVDKGVSDHEGRSAKLHRSQRYQVLAHLSIRHALRFLARNFLLAMLGRGCRRRLILLNGYLRGFLLPQ